MDVAALCSAIRDWTIAQIPCGAADLDQLVCDGKTLRGSIEPTAGGGSAFIVPGVNYLGGSRQLRRRVAPLSPPAIAGGGDTES